MQKLKKADLILPSEENESWLAFLTRELARALEKLGVQVRLLVPPKDKNPKPFLENIFSHSPDCTISFNGILPDQEGRFLADLIKVPHLAILTESPNNFLSFSKSSYTLTLSPDQQQVEILKQAGCERTLFFPLGAPIELSSSVPLEKRRGSVLMAPRWMDYLSIQNDWKKRLPPKMVELLDEVINSTLGDSRQSYYHSFQLALSLIDPKQLETFKPFITFPLFQEIETVLRAKDQIELLSAFKGMDIDLVIEKGTIKQWQKALGSICSSFRFHEGVSSQSLKEMISQTKIFLISSPQFKFGGSGDLYLSLGSGAYTFHSGSSYLSWAYHEKQGVFFYPYLDSQGIRQKAAEILSQPSYFQEDVNRGRKEVLERETWLQRAELLLNWAPHWLDELPNGTRLAVNKT